MEFIDLGKYKVQNREIFRNNLMRSQLHFSVAQCCPLNSFIVTKWLQQLQPLHVPSISLIMELLPKSFPGNMSCILCDRICYSHYSQGARTELIDLSHNPPQKYIGYEVQVVIWGGNWCSAKRKDERMMGGSGGKCHYKCVPLESYLLVKLYVL